MTECGDDPRAERTPGAGERPEEARPVPREGDALPSGAPITTGLVDDSGAGTLDAGPWACDPAGLAGLGEFCGRRAIEVFIVFFERLGDVSFTSTRRSLRV